jgi:tetratricopeptide (TPR) repeat protein
VGQSVTMHVIREDVRQRQKLESWKEIAGFFQRDERTVKRWEKEKGLPVHRMPENTGARVFAYSDELTRWMNSPGAETAKPNEPVANPQSDNATPETIPAPRRPPRWIFIATVAVLLIGAALLLTSARENDHEHRAAPSASVANAATPHRHEVDPVAQELYLSGRYHWDKRTPEDLNEAVSYFNKAIARDPKYAAAYVGLANCYNLLREFAAMPPEEAFPRALAAARKATELDDSSAEAHTALAFVTFYWNWDAVEAEREFQRAIALDPGYVTAHHWYATFLMVLGRSSEALQQIDRAQQLDPASTPILADKALIVFHNGRPEEAIALLKQLSASQPSFFSTHDYLAHLYLDEDDDPDFLQEASEAATLSHDEHKMEIARAGQQGYRAGGREGMLQNILRVQKKYFDDGTVTAFDMASSHARLQNSDEAIRYLKLSFHRHEVAFLAIRIHESLVPLHDLPAFRQLVIDAGLPPLS